MRKNGLDLKSVSRRDWCHERIFGSAKSEPILKIGRDVSGIPVVYQGEDAYCVPASITWWEQWAEKNHPDLSLQFLAKAANVDPIKGSDPRDVFDTACKIGICDQESEPCGSLLKFHDALKHRLGAYTRLSDLSVSGIYSALKQDPVLIGVADFEFAGPHMMIAYDVDPDRKVWLGISWSDPQNPQYVEINWDDVIYCALPLRTRPDVIKRFGLALSSFMNLLNFFVKHSKIIGITVLGMLIALIFTACQPKQAFGSSGVYARFKTTLASGVDFNGTNITLSSFALKSGEEIGETGDEVHFPFYLTIQPESSIPEDIECWSVNTSTKTFGCIRGISYLGGNTTTTVDTLARPHSAGESVIMSNTPFFYNRFIDNWTNQIMAGIKTFRSIPRVLSASTLPVNAYDLVTKAYADGLAIGSFVSGNIDTARGLSATGGAPEQVGMSLTPLQGNLSFDENGKFSTYTTSTASASISALKAVVASSTSGGVLMSNTSNPYSTFKFVGFSATSSASGTTAYIATPGTKLCGFSSLIPSAYYYLNGSNGAIATTSTSINSGQYIYKARVGFALTSTCLQIIQPSYELSQGIDLGSAVSGDVIPIVTGFYPASVEMRTGLDSGVAPAGMREGIHMSIGRWTTNQTQVMILNSSSTAAFDTIDFSSNLMWYVATSSDDSTTMKGIIDTTSVTQDGFNLKYAATPQVQVNSRIWVKSE